MCEDCRTHLGKWSVEEVNVFLFAIRKDITLVSPQTWITLCRTTMPCQPPVSGQSSTYTRDPFLLTKYSSSEWKTENSTISLCPRGQKCSARVVLLGSKAQLFLCHFSIIWQDKWKKEWSHLALVAMKGTFTDWELSWCNFFAVAKWAKQFTVDGIRNKWSQNNTVWFF